MAPINAILHVDMDAFYAAIEQRDHPELRGKPVVVGAAPDRRGVVATCSYEARRFGLHSAMPSREAARRCPEAIFRPCNMTHYSAVAHQIRSVFLRFTPLVEPVSIDEAFLDVGGSRRLFGDAVTIGERIRSAIRDEIGLTASVGVATNKFLAKLGSELAKPDGLVAVPTVREELLAFLAPLPVGRLWGVGKVLKAKLEQHGYRTIGDLQRTQRQQLEIQVGCHVAAHLLQLAFGEDPRKIVTEQEDLSLSREHTFDVDCRDSHVLRATLLNLVDEVGQRLRRDGRYASVGRLKLRWSDFRTITRQRHFEAPCRDDITMRQLAIELLHAENPVNPVRLIGFGVAGLVTERVTQPGLFDNDNAILKRREDLSTTIDRLRAKLGTESVQRADSVGIRQRKKN